MSFKSSLATKQAVWDACYGEAYSSVRMIWVITLMYIVSGAVLYGGFAVVQGRNVLFVFVIAVGFAGTALLAKWRDKRREQCILLADELYKLTYPDPSDLAGIKRRPSDSYGFPIA